jgi:hypothetical protein
MIPNCVGRARIGRTMGQAYFAHISQKGTIRYGDVPGSIGVLEALDKPMPIGEASCRTWDENGLAVWTLRIGKQEIPGRWVIIDRRFVAVEVVSAKESSTRPSPTATGPA